MLVGIAGAFIGGRLFVTLLGRPIVDNAVAPALRVAVIAGSLALLIVYRLLFDYSRDRR
ncbi:hypothetical protein [Streptomyces smyrnaeus]|uniref:hypothetical protein n=1 Tax=Streptomyces smyrnaeus TaxID=1387713 RepID=UPI0033CFD3C2